ncbi:MAG: GNAT family N-acetyltransferase [Acidimicrobiales bacterium]
MLIRVATPVDWPVVRDIEVQAGSLFRELGMDQIADDPPPTDAELDAAAVVLVAVDSLGELVGYARVELVDDHAHLEQLSVLPDHGGQGIGTSLLDAVASWATELGHDQITLTTFRDVAFNAPLYARRGFAEVPPSEWTGAISAAVAAEAAHGLDPDSRVVMARPLGQ